MSKKAEQPKRRIVQPGERLAIKPDVLHSGSVDGQKAMWWDLWTTIPSNERVGETKSVAVVHIRGALDHHREYGCDSYEGIKDRVREAIFGTDAHRAAKREAQEAKWRARWAEEDGEEPAPIPEVPDEPEPPSAIILRIDSPGGVVSGLNETVAALRKMFSAAGIPSIAFVDELCASAAYALACSCDEIVMPASAIAGSVGVIACMYDQVEADKKAGINVVTITSGARKADGHPHVPVSDDAVAAERRRVDRSAKAFFRLVAGARGLSPKIVRSYEAGIFQGPEAVEKGLADAVMPWESLVASLSDTDDSRPVKQKPVANGGQTEPGLSGTRGTASAKRTRMNMTVTLKSRIRSTEAALAKETDPKRKKALAAALATHKAALAAMQSSLEATKKTKIKYEESTEESEEEEEEESSAESDDEEEEASGNETDRKEDDSPGDDDDDSGDGDDEEDEEESEEEEEAEGPRMKKKARASLALLERETGKRGSAAIGAAAAMFATMRQTTEDVARLKSAARAKEKSDLIASAKRHVPKAQLSWLKTQPLAVVRGFVAQATKGATIVHTDEGELLVPRAATPGTEESLPKDTVAMIDAAMAACPSNVKPEVFRKTLVDAHLADHKKRLASANGVGRI